MGYYYIEICAGTQANTQVELISRGGYPSLAYVWKSTSNNGIDSGCRSAAIILSINVLVSIIETLGSAYSDSRLMTSWSMFSISNSMAWPGTLLYVPCYKSFNEAYNNIPFSQPEITPSGGLYNTATNKYRCNATGIYFFAMTAGVSAGKQAQVQLILNEYNPVAEMVRFSTSSNDMTTLSRNTLLKLQAGDEISVNLVQGQVEPGADTEALLSFTAFLYQLVAPTPSTAWSVFRSTSWTADNSAAIDPLVFNVVQPITNVDGASWNADGNRITINTGGYYYVYVSAGVQPYSPVQLTVKRNSLDLFGVYRLATNHNDVDTIGHGMLVLLAAGDQLRVVAGPNTRGYSSDLGLHTSFFGMLVYAV